MDTYFCPLDLCTQSSKAKEIQSDLFLVGLYLGPFHWQGKKTKQKKRLYYLLEERLLDNSNKPVTANNTNVLTDA